MRLHLICHGPLPPLRPQLQDRVHPSTLIAPSWRGKGRGHTPGCGLGKAGACGPIVPFPDVCSWWALSNERCGQVAPLGAERMFMHLKGSCGGRLPGTPSQPHPPSGPHWRRQDLAQGALGKTHLLGLVRSHSSKAGPHRLSEEQQD